MVIIDGVLEASKAMRRREFIAFIGCTAALWPVAVRAQQSERVRRYSGKFYISWAGSTAAMCGSKSDGLALIPRRLAKTRGRISRASDGRRHRPAGCSIPALSSTPTVGSGYVDTLGRPGGNATGFVLLDYALTAKWVELLKEIAPTVTRVAVLRDPELTSGVWPIRCDPVRGAICWNGSECDQHP